MQIDTGIGLIENIDRKVTDTPGPGKYLVDLMVRIPDADGNVVESQIRQPEDFRTKTPNFPLLGHVLYNAQNYIVTTYADSTSALRRKILSIIRFTLWI